MAKEIRNTHKYFLQVSVDPLGHDNSFGLDYNRVLLHPPKAAIRSQEGKYHFNAFTRYRCVLSFLAFSCCPLCSSLQLPCLQFSKLSFHAAAVSQSQSSSDRISCTTSAMFSSTWPIGLGMFFNFEPHFLAGVCSNNIQKDSTLVYALFFIDLPVAQAHVHSRLQNLLGDGIVPEEVSQSKSDARTMGRNRHGRRCRPGRWRR